MLDKTALSVFIYNGYMVSGRDGRKMEGRGFRHFSSFSLFRQNVFLLLWQKSLLNFTGIVLLVDSKTGNVNDFR